MKRKNILLNLVVSSALLFGGILLSSCSTDSNLNQYGVGVSLTITNEDGGTITFYKDGEEIDLTSFEETSTLQEGDEISFRITINSGYSFESLLLNGSNVSVTISSSSGNRTGSFTIVSGQNELVLTINLIETNLADFTFTYDEDTLEATLTSYTCSTSIAPNPVMIPETIEVDEKTYNVTGIANNAFSVYGAEIISIYIPKYIRDLEEQAFYIPVTSLTSFVVDEENENFVVYEGSLYTIDYSSLVVVPNGLRTVEIHSNTSTIGAYAFANGAISSITIPTSVTSIDDYAFYRATSLTSVSGGESLEYIGEWAFGYVNITSFPFSSNLKELGLSAFQEAELRTIDLTNTKLTSIPDGAFDHNDSLNSITFNDDIESIGSLAFWNCAITELTLPANLKTVGDNAFSQSQSLVTIDFNEKLESIGAYCFYQTVSVTSINLPESIKYIGEGAFSAIPALGNSTSNFTIGGTNNDNGYYKIQDGVLYEYNGSNLTLHTYPRGIQVSEFIMSEDLNVTNIKSWAFSYIIKLEKLTLPSTLTNIEENAFYGIYPSSDTTITELELCYNGSVEEFEINVTLEEGWNTDLTLKDSVIICNDGTYTIIASEE